MSDAAIMSATPRRDVIAPVLDRMSREELIAAILGSADYCDEQDRRLAVLYRAVDRLNSIGRTLDTLAGNYWRVIAGGAEVLGSAARCTRAERERRRELITTVQDSLSITASEAHEPVEWLDMSLFQPQPCVADPFVAAAAGHYLKREPVPCPTA